MRRTRGGYDRALSIDCIVSDQDFQSDAISCCCCCYEGRLWPRTSVSPRLLQSVIISRSDGRQQVKRQQRPDTNRIQSASRQPSISTVTDSVYLSWLSPLYGPNHATFTDPFLYLLWYFIQYNNTIHRVFMERGYTKLFRGADTTWNWDSSKWLKQKDIKI